jgi:hypothetical protein
MKKSITGISLFFLALITLCSPLFSEETYAVSGIVVDSATQKPLAGVEIVAVKDGRSLLNAVSSRDGSFKILLKKGDYSILFYYLANEVASLDIKLDGKNISALRVVIQSDYRSKITKNVNAKKEHSKKEEIKPDEIGAVFGVVTDAETGKPLAGAMVECTACMDVRKTDSQGKFRFQNVPIGNSIIKVTEIEHDIIEKTITIKKDEDIEQNFSLTTRIIEKSSKKKGSLVGLVKSKEMDSPLAYASIKVIGTKNRTKSDKNGNYTIVGIPPGDYEIEFSFSGYKTVKKIARILSDSRTILNCDMELFDAREDVIYGEAVEEVHSVGTLSRISADAHKATYGKASETIVTMTAEESSIGDGLVLEKTSIKPPSGRGSGGELGKAGVLTSGELSDFRKWNYWNELGAGEFSKFVSDWQFYPRERYTVQVMTNDNMPAVDVAVKLLDDNGKVVWQTRTDNTGKAELWANIFTGNDTKNNEYYAVVDNNGNEATSERLRQFSDGINVVKINKVCGYSNLVDISFVVDATGSMGDEINYLKAELSDIIGKLKKVQPDKTFRLGSIFYRDLEDEYLVRQSDFSEDISISTDFIDKQSANGGGDVPEAVELALMAAVNGMTWSENATARILFLILDAPPHNSNTINEKLHEIIAKAAAMGIRIVPVACSGIEKTTEFLMRSIALATNGSYVFLTDHSGVGGSHIQPSTDKYDVELLNDLFIRLIAQFTVVPECQTNQAGELPVKENILNEDEKPLISTESNLNMPLLNCYPNPSSGELTIEFTGEVEEIYLTDISGKLLDRIEISGAGSVKIDLTHYPTGVMFLKYRIGSNWGVTKVLLVR